MTSFNKEEPPLSDPFKDSSALKLKQAVCDTIFVASTSIEKLGSTYHLKKKLPISDCAPEEPPWSNGPIGSMSEVVAGGVCG